MDRKKILKTINQYSEAAKWSVSDEQGGEDTFLIPMDKEGYFCCLVYHYPSSKLAISIHDVIKNSAGANIVTKLDRVFKGKCNNTDELVWILHKCVSVFDYKFATSLNK